MAGKELCNAYSELNKPEEQRERLVAQASAVGGCGVVEDGEGDVDEVISSDDDEAFNVFDHCVDAMAKVSESDEDG